jgi:hypothetical protein
MPSPSKVQHTAIDVELGEKPARASVSEFQGKNYISLRYTYEDRNTHETKFGQNGINMQAGTDVATLIEVGVEAIESLINVLNVSAGTHYHLEMEDTNATDTNSI